MFDVAPGADELSTRRRFESWFPDLITQPETHARFVNTLSMLEHLGSVRMARTQSGAGITERVLEHLAEETRHAFYLKRLSRKIDGGTNEQYRDDSLIAGPSARMYFARLDATARSYARERSNGRPLGAETYLLVSWLVERRAMWLYPAYAEALKAAGTRYSVRSIINDEEDHLAEMVEGLDSLGVTGQPELPELVRQEESLFGRLADAMLTSAGQV